MAKQDIKKNSQAKLFESLFLHSKPVKMLRALKRTDIQYATQVSKHVDCTYSHTVKVLEIFRQLGLVTFDKKGRVKMIKLTPDGEEVALHLEGLDKKFSRMGTQIIPPQQPEQLKRK